MMAQTISREKILSEVQNSDLVVASGLWTKTPDVAEENSREIICIFFFGRKASVSSLSSLLYVKFYVNRTLIIVSNVTVHQLPRG